MLTDKPIPFDLDDGDPEENLRNFGNIVRDYLDIALQEGVIALRLSKGDPGTSLPEVFRRKSHTDLAELKADGRIIRKSLHERIVEPAYGVLADQLYSFLWERAEKCYVPCQRPHPMSVEELFEWITKDLVGGSLNDTTCVILERTFNYAIFDEPMPEGISVDERSKRAWELTKMFRGQGGNLMISSTLWSMPDHTPLGVLVFKNDLDIRHELEVKTTRAAFMLEHDCVIRMKIEKPEPSTTYWGKIIGT